MDAAPLANSNSNEVNPNANVQMVFDKAKNEVFDTLLSSPQMTENDSLSVSGFAKFNNENVSGTDRKLSIDFVALRDEFEAKFAQYLNTEYEKNKVNMVGLTPVELSLSARPITIPENYTGDIKDLSAKFGGGYKDIQM